VYPIGLTEYIYLALTLVWPYYYASAAQTIVDCEASEHEHTQNLLKGIQMALAWQGSGLDASLRVGRSWFQGYDPMRRWWLSALCAALPLIVLFVLMAGFRIRAHLAALVSLVLALLTATILFHMPASLAGPAALYGAAYGIFPIFWIVLPVLFIYQLAVKAGRISLLQACLVNITSDSRLQLILIAFLFGAFFEGISGFGTPVAVCGTILIGLGFRPLQAAKLALLANTAPVAFGSLGIPVIALHGVTGLDTLLLTRVMAFLLFPFCIAVPCWLIWAYAGFRKMYEVLPAILVAGVSFATVQLLVGVFHGPWLVDITASVISLGIFVTFLRFWKPSQILDPNLQTLHQVNDFEVSRNVTSRADVWGASVPWVILTVFVVLWGIPQFNRWIDARTTWRTAVPGLDLLVFRTAPIVAKPTAETAVFVFNWLSATGSGIFLSSLLIAASMKLRPRTYLAVLGKTLTSVGLTVLTIAALMAFAFVIRFSGLDATLGLAFARTGLLYPFFGTLIGWMGTAFTGSDTSSNVLFGSLQKFTALQLGIPPELMASANSVGGVMAKMIAPQSLVVASTAVGSYGSEGTILRVLLVHSIALALLMSMAVAIVSRSPSLLRLVL
jgi:lactate permease